MPLQHRKPVDVPDSSASASEKGQALGMSDDSSRLIKWDQLQTWQRNNAYIWGSYRRPSYSFRKSLQSLGFLHNESVNIYSHLLGSLLFIVFASVFWRLLQSRYPSVSWKDGLALGAFFISAIACLGMSATYHTISDQSALVNELGNKLDLLGIVCLIFGHIVSLTYYGWYCERTLKVIYCTMICVFGLACAIAAVNPEMRRPERRHLRTAMFIGLGCSAAIPAVHCLALYGVTVVNQRIALIPWLLIQWGIQLLAGCVYATQVPERYKPGTFDLWGNSHQMFHFLIVIASSLHVIVLYKAFHFSHTYQRC